MTGQGDTIPTTPVHAGYTFRTLDSIEHGELIYVTYRDSLNVPNSVLADYDQHRTIDSSLVLYHVRDSGMPRSLSIAFRNVEQVYPLDKYPSYITTDPGKTLIWTLFALPAFAFVGWVIGSAIGALISDTSDSYSDSDLSLGRFIGHGTVGLLAGVGMWATLTIPIR